MLRCQWKVNSVLSVCLLHALSELIQRTKQKKNPSRHRNMGPHHQRLKDLNESSQKFP